MEAIGAMLDFAFPDPPIPLDHTDDYTLLCAVMLSAQSTDGKVNEVTRTLFASCPTPQAMAQMAHADLLEIIRPLGLAPTKAKNLIACASRLLGLFGGRVPRSFKELESLAGVGHKTASCVMAQAFGVPTFAVDTHIHRLAIRWGVVGASGKVADVEAAFKAAPPTTSHLAPCPSTLRGRAAAVRAARLCVEKPIAPTAAAARRVLAMAAASGHMLFVAENSAFW
jgi:endonuclease-3